MGAATQAPFCRRLLRSVKVADACREAVEESAEGLRRALEAATVLRGFLSRTLSARGISIAEASSTEVTDLLRRAHNGDSDALKAVVPLVYNPQTQIRRLPGPLRPELYYAKPQFLQTLFNRKAGVHWSMNLSPEVENLFRQLADLDREQQSRYFEEHSTDPEIRRQVEALLASEQTIDSDLDRIIRQQVEATMNMPDGIASGEVCGPYRLLKLIGRGGMGEVWLAECRMAWSTAQLH